MTSLPSSSDLQKAWEDLQRLHKTHLAKHGVRLPDVERYDEHQHALWLAVLRHFQDQDVDKNFMSQVAARDMPHLSPDQQVRHLKRAGWEIEGSKAGWHKLNPFRPSSEFLNTEAAKRVRLEAGSFADLKAAFGHRCATCGAQEGEPDPRYGTQPVALQQGHQDPRKAGDDTGNIIPQCQFCNRAYRDDFVFDDKGRVNAVASIGPVKRASLPVQRRILAWLKDHLGQP